jgi:predicted nuclease of restriction endonuclease-like (RecB) superfamily
LKAAKTTYHQLLTHIGSTIENGRERAFSVLNEQMLRTYWEIGHYIVAYEQHGNERAEYGSTLLKKLSADLTQQFGKGFSRSNIQMMRQFFLLYPQFGIPGKERSKRQTSGKLSWSHYCELISISDDKARSFYEKQSVKDNWSVRELKRQINAALFERLALSKDKKGVMRLAQKGHEIAAPEDLVKDPYVFEFLGIPQSHRLTEKSLEKKLIDNLQQFLLELGKGFSLVARQYKITIDNEHYFIDLVFYHRILKCFVLIDLKISKVRHQDIGQMNLYLNYFREEENIAGDHDPIGIIIGADKNELLVKYATGGISNKIFVSKYKLYLPDSKLLEQKVKEIISGK